MSERLAKKVLLIGWDAADWQMIDPLLDSGKMPALERLVNGGVVGNLATLRPMVSPLLWTSIATGKRAYKHGITHFLEPDLTTALGVRSVRSYRRQCKAIWNILTQAGMRSNVVGWYATHPAEPINGAMVSDYYRCRAPLQPEAPWPLTPRSVHPERWTTKLTELRVRAAELGEEHLLPFIPQAARIDQRTDPRLLEFASALAECATIHNAVIELMENEPWDLTAVYYPTLDHVGHEFMYYYPPRMEDVPEPDFEIYKDVMPGIYRYHDMMLQRLLDVAGPDTTVIICSDHGFQCGPLRPRDYGQQRQNEQWHRPLGILCVSGAAVHRDARVYGATLLDIAPLVLTLLGLPVGEDMDGRVPQLFVEPVEAQTIASWEDVPGECGRISDDGSAEESAQNDEAIKQLVALGYLEAPGEDKQQAAANADRDAKYNLARALADGGRLAEAAEIMEVLCREMIDKRDARVLLAHWYVTMGRYEDARQSLNDAELGSDLEAWPAYARYALGRIEYEQSNAEKALVHFAAAQLKGPKSVELNCLVGNALRRLGKWQEAGKAFVSAIDLDPECAAAHEGLAGVFLALERNSEAAEEALLALGLVHYYPIAHYYLGVALARMGMRDRAIQALEVCLTTNPPPPLAAEVHELLAEVHLQLNGDRAKSDEHRELARQCAASLSPPPGSSALAMDPPNPDQSKT